MMDFRRVDIAKQKAYDLLRDWIKLVARHTNPDQDISELLGWLWKLKPATPDPITGLVLCGCGGRAVLDGAYGDDEVESSYRTEIYCEQCLIRTPIYTEDEQAKAAWNRAMGYKGGAE